MLESIWQDCRFAIRSLLKTPLFTLIVLFTLVAGVASVTAIFSYANAAYMVELPYKDADRIVSIGNTDGFSTPMAIPSAVRVVRTQARSFERVTAFTTSSVPLRFGDGDAQGAAILGVDTAFVGFFDLRPTVGRLP